jgi:integrase
LLLDYVGLDPNPAQDRRIKLPSTKGAPPTPPTREHVEAMLGRLPGKYLLPFVLLEQTGVRVETIEELDWANVDLPGRRIRVFEKGRGAKKVRWAQLPDWYTDMLQERAPPDARTGRVFPGVTADGLYSAMRAVCRAAGIPHYHPHDLRHRRASLWHLQGVPDAVLAERVGHTRASFTKDVYAHVMPVDVTPWQIDVDAHPWADARRLLTDWLYAARVAYRISNAGRDWTPWTTHSMCGV